MKTAAMDERVFRALEQVGLEAEMLTGCRLHMFEPGEYVLHQGAAMTHLYVIIEGTAKVCVNAENGRHLILCDHVSHGMLGEIALMTGEYAASTTVIAVSPFCCAAIPLSQNEQTLRENLAFVNAVGQSLARKLLSRSEAHMASALHSSEARLCAYILLTQHDGLFTDYLTDAAQSIGVSYRHVLRLIGQLCRRGILEKTQAGIRILDMQQLQACAEQSA